MITFAPNVKNVGKLTIKYKINKNCAPKKYEGAQLYPVYMRLTLHRKNTEFPLSLFIGQLYTNENGINFINDAKSTKIDDCVFYSPMVEWNLTSIRRNTEEKENNIRDFVEYYETSTNKNYSFSEHNLFDDLNVFNQSYIDILLDALFYSEFTAIVQTKLHETDPKAFFVGYAPDVLNPFAKWKDRPEISRISYNSMFEVDDEFTPTAQIIYLIANCPNTYQYYKDLLEKAFNKDITYYFPQSFIEKWKTISNLYKGDYKKTFGQWVKEYKTPDNYVKSLLRTINKDYFKM